MAGGTHIVSSAVTTTASRKTETGTAHNKFVLPSYYSSNKCSGSDAASGWQRCVCCGNKAFFYKNAKTHARSFAPNSDTDKVDWGSLEKAAPPAPAAPAHGAAATAGKGAAVLAKIAKAAPAKSA